MAPGRGPVHSAAAGKCIAGHSAAAGRCIAGFPKDSYLTMAPGRGPVQRQLENAKSGQNQFQLVVSACARDELSSAFMLGRDWRWCFVLVGLVSTGTSVTKRAVR